MKEIVVISGKGGTGKTSLTASYAMLGEDSIVVADCDVDAADMHLLLEPDFREEHEFYSGLLPVIDHEGCSGCGLCQQVCRFDAVKRHNSHYQISELNCEGCGYCARVCPEKVISMKDRYAGEWYVSKIRTGARMVHARLGPGTENSGKLVAKVKNEAKAIAEKEKKEMILIDGSPGIGCPVISSLSGASFAVLVTEPTLSALHDLKRVRELLKKFNIPAACIINKADLNPEVTTQIESFLKEEEIELAGSLPYDATFTKAIAAGQTIVEFDQNIIGGLVSESWKKILTLIENLK